MNIYILIIIFVLIFGLTIKINRIEKKIRENFLEKFEIKDENAKQQLLSLLSGGDVTIKNLHATGNITATGNMTATGQITANGEIKSHKLVTTPTSKIGFLEINDNYIQDSRHDYRLRFDDDRWIRITHKNGQGYGAGIAGSQLHSEGHINVNTDSTFHGNVNVGKQVRAHELFASHKITANHLLESGNNVHFKRDLKVDGRGEFKNEIDCNVIKAKFHRVKGSDNCHGKDKANVDIVTHCSNNKDVKLRAQWVNNREKQTDATGSIWTHDAIW